MSKLSPAQERQPKLIRKWRLLKKRLKITASVFSDKDYRRWLVREWMKEHKSARLRRLRTTEQAKQEAGK